MTVTITGATPGATYPWHIHDGKCTDSGPPIVGDVSAYNYIINIHASPMNLATIVACGDFND